MFVMEHEMVCREVNMARRKKPAVDAADETQTVKTVVAVAEPQAELDASSPAPSATDSRRRFRSWVAYRASGYERLTDEKSRLIVLKFRDKPSGETLELIKEAGFRYQPEYFGQTKVWTCRNDFEGRQRVEQLGFQLRGQARGAVLGCQRILWWHRRGKAGNLSVLGPSQANPEAGILLAA
jgi:hypothetical protein